MVCCLLHMTQSLEHRRRRFRLEAVLSWLVGGHCKLAKESEAAGEEWKVATEAATLSEHTVFTFFPA